MVEPQKIKITDMKHMRRIHEFMGVSMAHQLLSERKCDAPGFALAVALVAAELNEQKAACSFTNIKIIAKAGIDVDKVKSMQYSTDGEIIVHFYDLADEP